MREFDSLPSELRVWLASALFPWSPRSVRRVYKRALLRTRDKDLALTELDQLQQRKISQDVQKVWGPDHPLSSGDAAR